MVKADMKTETASEMWDALYKAEYALWKAKKERKEKNKEDGLWMRHKREQVRLSLREVARRMKVSSAYLSDLELGNREWSFKVLAKWDRAMAKENL